jgi:hypothetical protein
MTLDGLLGALALVVALFALVPAVQRLRASLAIPVQMLVAVPALLMILWLQFYEPELLCPIRLGNACDWLTIAGDSGAVARKNSFLVLFGWAVLAFVLHHFSPVKIGSVPAMARLAQRLFDEDRLGEALSLLVPNIDLFVEARNRKSRWQRLHDRLASVGLSNPFFVEVIGQPSNSAGRPEWLSKAVRLCALAIPAQRAEEMAARDIFEMVHSSPRAIKYLAEERPDLAIPFLRANVASRGEFSDAFLLRLIEQPGSFLYREIEQNQNVRYPVGYDIPERNRILNALFADSKFAVEVAAWKPIGDYLLRLLDGAEKVGHIEWLNGSAKWYEKEWWRDPVFVSLLYFDIMVSSAIAQGTRDHMWLFYYPAFAERLAKIYSPNGNGIDRNAEFPTRSARLLYELISHLTKWISSLPELPEESPHKTLPTDRHAAYSIIPFAATVALGQSFAAILRTDRLDQNLLETLHSTIALMMRRLPKEDRHSTLRQWVIRELISGGGYTLKDGHNKQLLGLLMNADHVLRFDLDDYEAALELAVQS